MPTLAPRRWLAPSISAALKAYEAKRLPATSAVVHMNRTNPPDAILREVFERTGVNRTLLWKWYDRGELSEARIAAYQRRRFVRNTARKLGVKDSTLDARVARGMDPLVAATKPVRRYRVPPEVRAQMRELRAGGATCEEIGRELGIAKSTAARWLRRAA